MNKEIVDIQENEILKEYPEVLVQLLRDHTTGNNIFWALRQSLDFNNIIR